MADERKYYVLCADNCKFESMTKEQILAAITQVIEQGKITDVDSGFVTTLKELKAGTGLRFWVGTQAEYNTMQAAGTLPTDCFCIITDDTTADDINAKFAGLEEYINQVNEFATSRFYLSEKLGLNKTLWTGEQLVDGESVTLDIDGAGDYRLFAITADLWGDGMKHNVLVYAVPQNGMMTLEYNGNFAQDETAFNFIFLAYYYHDSNKLVINKCHTVVIGDTDNFEGTPAKLFKITGVL